MAQTSQPQTERLHAQANGLDARSDRDIAATLLSGQSQALDTIATSLDDLTRGAALMTAAVAAGGRLIYAAAGSSALMALADAAELSGTYGISADSIRFFMAGGVPMDGQMPGHTEDDSAAAKTDGAMARPGDVVIAVTASGSTPYPLTFVQTARAAGAQTVCIANNADAAIFAHADVAIHLATPPEVIAGSTRLGAATAQKAALNIMSTLMGVRLGHVHDGMMVNLIADNAKLRGRAATIVAIIARVDEDEALSKLDMARGAVKPAVLMAMGVETLDEANTLLGQTKGHLRAALARM